MSFVFYDTETTGISKAFDQILQFGAIRTDENLNEIDRFEVRCRLLPYVVPSPGAMRITGVTVAQLTDPTLPSHYEMMRSIRATLSAWSPAVFIGHNSLGFDEPLLRQAFYQTLHPLYLTNTNGNCRADSLRMVQAAGLFARECLTIPRDDRGFEVYKLDRLAPANGFDHAAAHEAMSDVEATIHLCRLIAERAPELWSSFVRFSQKAAVRDYLADEEVHCLSDFYFGRPYSWLVTPLDTVQANNSEVLVYDLNIPPESLSELTDEALIARLKRSPKPVRRIRTNAFPILMPKDDAPPICAASALHPDELEARVRRLRDDALLTGRLSDAFNAGVEPRAPSPHLEEQIYDEFTGAADQQLLDEFHASDWPLRPAIIDRIGDARLRSCGRRLLYVERPDLLDEAVRGEFRAAVARRLTATAEDTPWLTLPRAITEAGDLIAHCEGEQQRLLEELRDYLTDRLNDAAAILA